MHEQITALYSLWHADVALDALIEERATLDTRIRSAEQDLARLTQKREQAESSLNAIKTEERTHRRRYETYVKRRDDTRLVIDEGRASDYQVAERQFTSCSAIADEEETAILEILERTDEITAEVDNATSGEELRSHRLDTRVNEKEERLPGLEEEIQCASDSRDQAQAQVGREWMGRYRALRKRSVSCIAPVRDGKCQGCHVSLSRQDLSEHKRAITVHHCKNCGRFFGELL